MRLPSRGKDGDGGYVTPAFVATTGFTMLLLVVVANLLVLRYADGILQTAVEEGVRQGVATGDPTSCTARAASVVAHGLGPMASAVAPATCSVAPDGAAAEVHATFAGWLPIVPDHVTSAVAHTAALAVD